MKEALNQAKFAIEIDEVPVGAVIVDKSGKIISKSHNLVEKLQDPSSHAELVAIKNACKILGTKNLSEYDLYVTLEPCSMCASLISFSRIRRLYFGAYDVKMGGTENFSIFSNKILHRPEIYGGIMEEESEELLKKFFKEKRNKV